MSFVDDHQPDALRDRKQHVLHELVVREPLRGNQKSVGLVLEDGLRQDGPIVAVAGVDAQGRDAEALCGLDLVAHQRQQRRHDESRPVTPIAQNACGDEIDRALAPAGALDQQQPCPVVHQRGDRLPLAIAEFRAGVVESSAQQRERLRTVGHGRDHEPSTDTREPC